MNTKEQIQLLYEVARQNSGGNTALLLEFLNWLHYEKGEVHHLQDMVGLSMIERAYIEQLLDGTIPKNQN